MANTFKALFRGAAPTSSTTLYTVPSGTTALVSSFVVANTASVDATYSILMNGVGVAGGTVVAGNDSVIIEFKQVLESSQILAGFASASTVNFSISGLEIS
jgi:hypothetical protein